MPFNANYTSTATGQRQREQQLIGQVSVDRNVGREELLDLVDGPSRHVLGQDALVTEGRDDRGPARMLDLEQDDVPDVSKAKEIERVFAKARRSAAGGVKKPRKVVVARKYHRGNAGGPSVDKRQLADLRGQRASAKRAGKGGRGGGKGKGKGGRGRGR